MRSLLLLLLFLVLLPGMGAAQQFRGRIYDKLSGAPMGSVLVTNTRTAALWLSDSTGHVAFTAFPGNVISFQRPGYKPYMLTIVSYTDIIAVGLERAPVQLQGVEVLSPMARYKRDSAFNRQFFHKELGYVPSQIHYGGLSVSGLFEELALLATGKKKEVRRFQEEMLFLEKLQFTSIRYNTALVTSQTGLNDTAAMAFIARNPLPTDYLRVASELELKMRVREMYREELRLDSLKHIH